VPILDEDINREYDDDHELAAEKKLIADSRNLLREVRTEVLDSREFK
jgi:hypothetical protein